MTVFKEFYMPIFNAWYIRVDLIAAVFLLAAAALPSAESEALSDKIGPENKIGPDNRADGMVPNPGGSPPCIPGPGVCVP